MPFRASITATNACCLANFASYYFRYFKPNAKKVHRVKV